MSARTGITWCDSTVNFWEGCTKVSPACDHCYAERKNKWLRGGANWGPGAPRLPYGTASATVRAWQRNAAKFRSAHGRDRRVFVNSTSDWLDNEVPIEWLVTLLDTVRTSPDVTFLLLSKRIGNWRKRLGEASNATLNSAFIECWLRGMPPPNVWMMATFVTQEEADRDMTKLLAVPARVRGLSIEPMLGEIDFYATSAAMGVTPRGHPWANGPILQGIDWVIAGGESGPKARPMHPDWVRSLRYQCATAGVAFHFKQWGEWLPSEAEDQPVYRGEHRYLGGRAHAFRIGTKAAGRLLDGIEHNGFPA